MKRFYYLFFIPYSFFFLSCNKEIIERNDCGDRYNYYQSEKKQNSQNYNKGVISFYDSLSNDTIREILKDYNNISFPLPEYSYHKTYVVVDIASNSCTETEGLFTIIKQDERISDCSKWLLTSDGLGFGYNDIFYCKLKHDSLENDMLCLIAETQTTFIEKSYNVVFIKADKTSQGDALDMANYFYESGYFEFSRPNRIGNFSTLDQ